MCFLICFVEAQHFIKYQNNIKKYHDIFRVCRNRRDPGISQSVSKVAFFCNISCISYSCLRFKGFVYLNLYTFNHDCGPCGMPAICQSIHHCIFQRITDSACIGWIFGHVGHYSSMSRKYGGAAKVWRHRGLPENMKHIRTYSNILGNDRTRQKHVRNHYTHLMK